jgi:hypothetical protein
MTIEPLLDSNNAADIPRWTSGLRCHPQLKKLTLPFGKDKCCVGIYGASQSLP